ncbi:MAG: SDR family oxidoreductase [Actinomycetota bacterium]|nr:SDR family oxidoreductase [Actinomycetota bacterium]MEE3139915.1 SDR family oxidoreductase [Actinomycetota bacterium]MEE3187034.1 SDR family oxidoreductase [Actinomycetota bacterium]
MGRLEGKVAIITGAGSGMGAATAQLFVSEGARVLVTDMNDEKGHAVADELGDFGDFLHVDVSRETDIAEAVSRATSHWGRLDVMFNNAGFGGARGPVESISEDDFDITVDVLLKGVFFGMKHAAPVMKAQESGAIISTASVAGLQAGESPHLYTATKAAVIHLTKSVALELGQQGIRVNAICPGVVATPLAHGPLNEDRRKKFRDRFGRYQPIGRVGEPDDIANAALFLASDDSTFITGTAMVVDGGANAGRPWHRQSELMTDQGPIKLYRPEGR